tara:strand:- start:4484 stop:6166 length:1683 start_codon:yes stop_codon:yes gene_type:complete
MINNKILALKYRPQDFKDLIGQDVIAKTITNAIKLGKTPNAYLLTGIRGVGKTTSARLIAKALNCENNLDTKKNCSNTNHCNSCVEIVNSNHIDVLEMDAASKTGIDDVRELIENSKYSPTSAQYKIFIIDEVHMLSKQAFNGLLKTLEEPPLRLKFILATTEVRKIPVTILSRCQRFDLKRVNSEMLFKHLKNISLKENGKISDEALRLIAHTSEGSVRDAISLLDRALISEVDKEKNEIRASDVRVMLGLADRTKIINVLNEALLGNSKKATTLINELIENGLDIKIFLNDILEILYLLSRRINLGPIENDTKISEIENNLIDKLSMNLNMQDVGLFWQLTIKTIDDLKIISNENLAIEMYIMQLTHLKNIEQEQMNINLNNESSNNKNTNEEKEEKNNLFKKNNITSSKDQLKNIDQVKEKIIKKPVLNIDEKNKINLNNFQELIDLANIKKEAELKYDLERNVKLVSFRKGKIDISFNEKLNKNFIKNLTEKLILWTGERWLISLSKNDGAKTVYQKNLEEQDSKFIKAKNNDVTKKFISAFPDAELIKIQEEDNA